MPTPLTQSSAFCTAAQFLLYVRWTIVADYLSDNGQPLTRAEVLASTKLAEHLLNNTGVIMAAANVGKRYTPEDLAALTGAGAALLRKITAGLTVADVIGQAMDPKAAEYALHMQALDFLEAINKGERIFAILEHAEAGLSDSVVETAQDMDARHSVTYEARRLFGRRSAWRVE